MKIHLIAVGTKMPPWVRDGYNEYAKRLPKECQLVLHEVIAGKRTKKAEIDKIIQTEGQTILKAIPPKSHIIALDSRGDSWSTESLAERLKSWMSNHNDVALLVGGADGLSTMCAERAHQKWSLSQLTLPHAMVRVLVAEALYRAWSLISHHPYHRAG